MSLGETVIYCGLEGLFLCESYPLEYSCLENHGQRSLAGCSPRGCRVGQAWVTEHIPIYPSRVALLVWGLIFVGIPATFSVCAGCCPLGKGCEWFCGDQTACAGCWAGASSLLCGCHSPAWGRVSWSSSRQIHFQAAVWSRHAWGTFAGRGATEYSSTGAVHSEACSVVACATLAK